MSIKFRFHRGTLKESLQTVVEIGSRAELAERIGRELGRDVSPESLKIQAYGFDNRIGWDGYMVSVEGWGVAGFIDGPL